MTRYARAKGSKASNERVPEEATSWQTMKQQMVQINKRSEIGSQVVAENNSTNFQSNVDDNLSSTWAKFPGSNKKTEENQGDAKKKRKTKSNKSLDEPHDSNSKLDGKESGSPEINKDSKKKKKRKLNKTSDQGDTTNSEQVDHTQEEQHNTQKKFKSPNKQDESKKFKEYKRRKPNSMVEKVFINGNEIDIAYCDGFPIKKVDADRLKQLKKQMISKGIPHSEVQKALKLERRKAEKALAREKKKVCFNCRQSGHILSECPTLKEGSNAQMTETGICFKCGSTEHTHFECKVVRGDNFKFAQCFICKEQGHISRQCPDNNRGLYPKGGACRVCGDVTHLKKDCPKYQIQQQEHVVVAHTINDQNIESLENETVKVEKKSKNIQKIVKF